MRTVKMQMPINRWDLDIRIKDHDVTVCDLWTLVSSRWTLNIIYVYTLTYDK